MQHDKEEGGQVGDTLDSAHQHSELATNHELGVRACTQMTWARILCIRFPDGEDRDGS